MARIFISYSRKDEQFARRIAASLSSLGADVWIDVEDIPAGMKWSSAIQQGLRQSQVMILIVSPDSMASTNVEDEWQDFLDNRKPIIPMLVRPVPTADIHFQLRRIQYLDFTRQDYEAAFAQLHSELARKGAALNPLPLPPVVEETPPTDEVIEPEPPPQDMPETPPIENNVIASAPSPAVEMEALEATIADPPPAPQNEVAALFESDIPATVPQDEAPGNDALFTSIEESSLVFQDAPIDTSQSVEDHVSVEVDTPAEGALVDSPPVTKGDNAVSLPYVMPEKTVVERIAEPQPVQRPLNRLIIPAALGLVILVVIAALALPRLAAPSTPIPTYNPNMKITTNADWQIITQNHNGVDMVLVPAGCFQMGNDPDAYYWAGSDFVRDVPNGGEQCFDPFWLDKYEVTNAQFAALNGTAAEPSHWTNPNRPRENITSFEARDYCQLRGGRLPTEAQWEYAARGPDNLFYPWGNTFVFDNVAYFENAKETVDVGSRPLGASWVGALDMSGNVWEWTSSIYQDYPYRADDGREEDSQATDILRSGRGGSFNNYVSHVRAAARFGGSPQELFNNIGLRCLIPITSTPATPTAEEAGNTPLTPTPFTTAIAHNTDWTPVAQVINNVEMVLVPAGCFQMGNDPDAQYYENGNYTQGVPDGGQQCFDQPFWLDKTEVTNGQFTAFNGVAANQGTSTAPNHPRTYITWFESHDYCALRGGRLPTEAEWEYAARGPDNLKYPWGDEFIADDVVYTGNAIEATDVGSKPEGKSWVGALDMSGNVWEWTASYYEGYPYNRSDGREQEEFKLGFRRSVRGGSFNITTTGLRAADRDGNTPDDFIFNFGFRCLLPYSAAPVPLATATSVPPIRVPTTSPFPIAVVISNQNVNVRSGPSTSSGVIQVLLPGSTVTILETVGDGAWYHVRTSSSSEGYISSTVLAVIGTATPEAVTNPSSYVFKPSSDVVFAGYTDNAVGCNWQGIGGQVYDLQNSLLSDVRVHVIGENIDTFAESIASFLNGGVGWEIQVDTKPNNATYYVELQAADGSVISPRVTLQFPSECSHNFAIVNFNQVREQ